MKKQNIIVLSIISILTGLIVVSNNLLNFTLELKIANLISLILLSFGYFYLGIIFGTSRKKNEYYSDEEIDDGTTDDIIEQFELKNE